MTSTGRRPTRPAGPRGEAGGRHRLRTTFVNAFAADVRSLAVLRIGVALTIIIPLMFDLPDLKAFWADDGLVPRAALLELWRNPWLVSIHMGIGAWQIQALLIAAQLVLAHGLLLGYRTRLMTAGSWFLLMSLQTRNPLILQGGDDVLRLLLFWGIFLPWGACWSLDARGHAGGRPLQTRVLTGGSLAYLAQVAIMYISAATLKTGAEWRSQGSAVYYALSINQIATPFAHWLLNFPEFLRLLTFSTVILEGFGPLLFIFPFWNGPIRTAAIAALVLLHLGFQASLKIGFFPMISIVAVLGLLPSWFWDQIELRILSRDSIRSRAAAGWARLQGWLGLSDQEHPNPDRATLTAERRLLRPGILLNAVPLLLIGYVCFWNLTVIDKRHFHLSDPLQSAGWLLRLDQHWNIFAPFPFRDDGWYVIPGTLVNGRQIDVYRDGAPISYRRPADVSASFKTYRWWKYLNNLYGADLAAYRLYYGRYLCRQWNGQHSGGEVLESFAIVYMRQVTQPNFQPRDTERVVIWEHRCF